MGATTWSQSQGEDIFQQRFWGKPCAAKFVGKLLLKKEYIIFNDRNSEVCLSKDKGTHS